MTDWNPHRTGLGQFAKGSGGRPPGARNRPGRKLRAAIEKSLDRHAAGTIEKVRKENPLAYLRFGLAALPTPNDDTGDPDEKLTPAEAEARLREFVVRLIAAGYGPDAGELPPREPGAPD